MRKNIQNDMFTISTRNINKFFREMEKNPTKYSKSFTKLQQEYINAWKTVINSVISLEREYASNAGFLTDATESSLQTVREMTDASIQAYLQQNMTTLLTVEATKQAFSTFNENTKSFVSLNEEIMEYLMSLFEQKSKC
ncbi:hypothetical protein AAA799B03_01321 [Marine Group I thaumarchaeote SCGC AAA799-B03]|uniref:Uncharacterized protein n=3 Tax=Marine Group I TaxID=905826 RepID=A0A087S5Z6_9ARCH|nr:hypothetical protein AAA799N04_01077 [Marine Group I thaumarchaeote SCGC AAA799-N04]KFM19190.1 hypothetical protein SCCGRSA3_00775 [Marine Group I thaumarchaeote SCGC RSA3]KFM21150.1 hypothetical protein AAA799B03_01321 [Marine Group I thaumarchaeote SCGC AAA799-B03]